MCHLTAQTRSVSLLAAPGLLACPIRPTVVLATSSARVNEARGQPFLVTSPGAGCPPARRRSYRSVPRSTCVARACVAAKAREGQSHGLGWTLAPRPAMCCTRLDGSEGGKSPNEHEPVATTGEDGGGHTPAALPGPSVVMASVGRPSLWAAFTGSRTLTGSCTFTRSERPGGVTTPGRHEGRTKMVALNRREADCGLEAD